MIFFPDFKTKTPFLSARFTILLKSFSFFKTRPCINPQPFFCKNISGYLSVKYCKQLLNYFIFSPSFPLFEYFSKIFRTDLQTVVER